jgi:hypothetical protein
VVLRQLALRSVHSEFRSHAIEPRKRNLRWSFRFLFSGSSTSGVIVASIVVRPGSKNMSRWTSGLPRNLGGPAISTATSRSETPGYQPLACRCADGGDERYELNRQQPWYRKATGTERRETNDRESEHLDSTVEIGELALVEDSPEGSEMPHQTTDVGNYVECSVT